MASKVADIKEYLERTLNDRSKPWAVLFDHIEARTGINRLHAFIGIVAVVAFWLVFGYAGQLLCNGIGFVYPAYLSIRAIESPQKDDDTKWLTYWVVFAAFSLVEFFSDKFVGWFPFYWLAKCVFLLWLMCPGEYNGAILLYRRFIRPAFHRHQGQISAAASEIKAGATKIVQDLTKND